MTEITQGFIAIGEKASHRLTKGNARKRKQVESQVVYFYIMNIKSFIQTESYKFILYIYKIKLYDSVFIYIKCSEIKNTDLYLFNAHFYNAIKKCDQNKYILKFLFV